MDMDSSEVTDRLAMDIDDLRTMKNSRGYALFVAEIGELRKQLVSELIKLDPVNTSKIGRNQGGILAYDYLAGTGSEDPFLTQMIDGKQAEIDNLKPRART